MESSSNPDRDPDHDGRDSDASNESYAYRSSDEHAQLPEYFLLPRPGFLAPESATRRREVVEITDLFHAQPAELSSTHRTCHVVAAAIVHLDDEHFADRTRFDVRMVPMDLSSERVKSGTTIASSSSSRITARVVPRSHSSSCITRLVRMPFLFAVVTEGSVASWSSTCQLGTASTARCNHNIPTVWCWTPTCIWFCTQDSTQHELLVLRSDGLIIQDHPDVVGMKRVTALWTGDVDPWLWDLYPQVLLQTVITSNMMTGDAQGWIRFLWQL